MTRKTMLLRRWPETRMGSERYSHTCSMTMLLPALAEGSIFFYIENGVRFTCLIRNASL